MSKKAVILMNLGGPENLAQVKSFLFNLFYDKAIIDLPNPFRYFFAKIISSCRNKKAQNIYAQIGGKSPILEFTKAQAQRLEKKINSNQPEVDFKVFVCMRYSEPSSDQVVKEIMQGGYGEILLIPLYPQFSTTTTESSYHSIISKIPNSYSGKIKLLCCYPKEKLFIDAHVDLIKKTLKESNGKNLRLLFSAHGLPEKIIKKGDPYQWQVEQTCEEIVKRLPEFDHRICYQSKVGPLKWTGPSTKLAIEEAAKDGVGVVMIPVAFVSEHSETLVELDIEYKDFAKEIGIESYFRVPALGINEFFIDALSELCIKLSDKPVQYKYTLTNLGNKRFCPEEFCRCIRKE